MKTERANASVVIPTSVDERTSTRAGGVPAAELQVLGDAEHHHRAHARRLIAHAKKRAGWATLTPTQRKRAEELILAADDPENHVLAINNLEKRDHFGWSQGQSQKLVRAMKNAHLLDVRRNDTTNARGRKRTEAPATWLYAPDDRLRYSQIPKKRKGGSESKVRSLQLRVDLLEEELLRQSDDGGRKPDA